MPTTAPQALPLGLQMLRGAGIFQALIALPICLFLGFNAFISVLEPYDWMLYYFLTDTTTSIMAASIIFSVYVQRKAIISPHQYLLFEAFKSLMATGLWLWLILDAAFGPWVEACRKESWCHYETGPRVTRAGLASVVLFVFYYPPLGYSYLVWKESSGKEGLEGERVGRTEEESERSPLLA